MRNPIAIVILVLCCGTTACTQNQRWSEEKARAWYAQQPWLVGANYIPGDAINELEMWQADTFDPKRIDQELGWAQDIGMNTMRVFLHDLLWQQDADAFKKRVDQFLAIAQKHQIRPLFVLFDSCWDPFPKLGKQHDPTPGVHNSGWVQSPGARTLQDKGEESRLEAYVKGIVGAFGNDDRVLGWDVWNEPDNPNGSSYGKQEPANKTELVLALLQKTYVWARAVHPQQPLTSGIWKGADWSALNQLTPLERVQLEQSDVISFHSYDGPEAFRKRITSLQGYHRPILCTEYMARGNGSTFEGTLPIAKEYKVAAINWGLVQGKTQTNLPWDSWKQPYVNREPKIWFHEVFQNNGAPYKPEEVQFIQNITGAAKAKKAA